MGPPASGKSYLARRLATSFGATLVQSDTVRKQLFRAPTYSAQESAAVFAEAHRLIEASLRAQKPTIFDATNLQERHRATLYGIAAACQVPTYLFWLKAPEGVAAARIAQRTNARDAEDLSEATWPVYQHLAETAEPPARSHVYLNATLPVGELVWLVQRIVSFS
jgi:predicted kinase